MESTPNDRPLPEAAYAAHQFPALYGLGCGEQELAALCRQGFLSREQRTPEQAPIYKLRYRMGGRQRTRYVGSNLVFVEQVRNELAVLQAAAKRAHKLQQLLRQARRALRRAKSKVAPLLVAESGYHYHGHAIRRKRPAGAPQDGVAKEVAKSNGFLIMNTEESKENY